jgi:hypothetical protein
VFEAIFKIRLLLAGIAAVVFVASRLAGGFSSAPPTEPLRLPPRPSATAAPAALTAFATRAATGGIRARARIDGVMHFAVPVYEVRATARVRGNRASVAYDRGSAKWLVFSGAGGIVRTRAARNGTWVKLPTGVKSGNPFGKPEAVEVQYKGRATMDKKKLHHLVISNPRSLAAALGGGDQLTQFQPEFSAFDVYVNDKGVPVKARVRFNGTAALTGITVRLNIDYRYTFASVR